VEDNNVQEEVQATPQVGNECENADDTEANSDEGEHGEVDGTATPTPAVTPTPTPTTACVEDNNVPATAPVEELKDGDQVENECENADDEASRSPNFADDVQC
jgi:hypothetical protein